MPIRGYRMTLACRTCLVQTAFVHNFACTCAVSTGDRVIVTLFEDNIAGISWQTNETKGLVIVSTKPPRLKVKSKVMIKNPDLSLISDTDYFIWWRHLNRDSDKHRPDNCSTSKTKIDTERQNYQATLKNQVYALCVYIHAVLVKLGSWNTSRS